ncbi:MAG: hypothetical protein LOD85_08175 [Clostridia bacterium]|nr:hypothetical protein [Bacillota bacterium]MBO2520971.1 hypothetical protein [Bacillota bacterium]
MAHKCKVCGEEMVYRVGEHYRHTERGMVLYRDVRQYRCPRGCPGAFFDYRYAHPVDEPERILGFIPVPRTAVNVVDPVLYGGLFLGYALFVAGALLVPVSAAIKGAAVLVVTVLALLLVRFMRTPAEEPGEQGE